MTGRRSGSERVAQALRDEPPRLGDVGSARMEKALLDRLTEGGRERTDSGVMTRVPARRGGRAWLWTGAAALVAAAAALAVALWPRDEGVEHRVADGSPPASATFQSFVDGESLRRGAFAEGETVRTLAGQRVEVRMPHARVDVTPGSSATFERVGEETVEVVLAGGAVEVEFHPTRPGEQTLSVITDAARIEVVGTVFRVEVGDDGATTVRVEEGTVRVVPRDGRDARLVRAGQATRVVAARAEATGAPARGAVDAPVGSASSAARAALEEPAAPVLELPSDEAPEPDREVAEVRRPDLSPDSRFDLAETLERRGRIEQARHLLREVARTARFRRDRVTAWMRLAESYSAVRDHHQAAEAYRRASEVGRGTHEGRNALYAMGMMRERQGNRDGARAAYRRYVDEADEARGRGDLRPMPHLDLARQALCRLGDRTHCAP